jgi:hypothetical protein
MSKKMIEDFIIKNKNWVDEKRNQVLERLKTYTQ